MAANNRGKNKQNAGTPQPKVQTAKAVATPKTEEAVVKETERGLTDVVNQIDDSPFQDVKTVEESKVDETQDTPPADEQGEDESQDSTEDDAPETNPADTGTQTAIDQKPVEQNSEKEKEVAEPEKQVLDTTPQPKSKGRFKPATTPIKLTTDIKKLTINEVVKHKHDYDLDKADGAVLEVIEFLNRYEEQMKPTVNTDELIGESLQRQLYKNYLKILGLDPVERGVCMEILLWKYFIDEKSSFRVSNLSRYTRNGKWVIEELQMYLQLNNLFNIAKDPSERIAKLRSIKLGPTVENFPRDKAKYTESLITWANSLK